MPRKVLILGGTAEAREIAGRAHFELFGRVDVITSLAGRTSGAAPLPGAVRVGGFGGALGLAEYLTSEKIDIVVDATHPFAEQISDHAHDACLTTETQRIVVVRPPWRLSSHGKWMEVDSLEAAAERLPKFSTRVFLTIGRRGLEAFAELNKIWFLVRLIEQPEEPLPLEDYEIVTGRPPFDLEAERALIAGHGIDCLLAKHSGGHATEAKIVAAMEATIPVVLIARPPRPPGLEVETVDECLAWLESQV